MKVLVTGGAGFIGSHVIKSLLDDGHSVVCVDNFNEYYDPEVKENNIEPFRKNKQFTILKGDVTHKASLEPLLHHHPVDQILHLAAGVGVRASLEDPLGFEHTNVGGTLTLLELCKKHNIKKFVFASSSSIYGENKKTPFSESDPVDNIISPYAASKRSAELFCEVYSKLYGLNITCLRFFTVYGPSGRPEMAPYKFVKAVHEGTELPMFGDGSSKRDYTYVGDIVSGIRAALDKSFPFEIINLGNSSPISLKDFISTVEEVVGKKANIKHLPDQQGDVSQTYADISKAKELLGYDPQTDLKTGLTKLFEWYTNGQKD